MYELEKNRYFCSCWIEMSVWFSWFIMLFQLSISLLLFCLVVWFIIWKLSIEVYYTPQFCQFFLVFVALLFVVYLLYILEDWHFHDDKTSFFVPRNNFYLKIYLVYYYSPFTSLLLYVYMVCLFILQHFVSRYKMCLIDTFPGCLKVYSAMCFLIVLLNLFTFDVIADEKGLISTNLLFVYNLYVISLVSPFSLSSFVFSGYLLMYLFSFFLFLLLYICE